MRALGAAAYRELALQLRLLARDGSSIVLTVVFPVLSLSFVMWTSAGARVPAPGYRITTGMQLLNLRQDPDAWVGFAAYGASGMIVLGLAVACFAHLAIDVATAREHGELRRIRATPLPPAAFLAGKIGAALVTGLALSVVLLGAST
ncbi:MAG TPA: hypothetical protein VGA36_09395, partial [Nitriliruptorales bacterium]